MKVLVDGQPLPDDEARAFWQRFSDWMEEHKGDLGGFAAKEGFASVHPGVQGGRPVLIVSKSAVQKPYGPVTDHGSPGGGAGSGGRHGGGGGGRKNPGKKRR